MEHTFEDKLKALEETVTKLESGNVPLEEMMELYEKGRKLYSECDETLSSFEKKLKAVEE